MSHWLPLVSRSPTLRGMRSLQRGVAALLACLIHVGAAGCAGSHRGPGEELQDAGTPARDAGRQGGSRPSDDPVAVSLLDAGLDAAEPGASAPDAASAADAGEPCPRMPTRQAVLTAMNDVRAAVSACFVADGVLYAYVHIDPADGRVVTVEVEGVGTPEEWDCAAMVLLEDVRLDPFCPPDPDLYGIRYPFRIQHSPPAPRPGADDDAGSGTITDAGVDATGTLRVNTRPWSVVTIDGVTIGNTPQLNISLSEGTHTVELVNEDLGLAETVEVEITAGEVTTLVVALGA